MQGKWTPLLILKRYIYDVLNSADHTENKMILDMNYQSNVDMSLHRIDIYMNSSLVNNPVIKFLHDLMEHKHLIRRYKLNIHFVLGQCSKCREKNFMYKEKGCLSGGRYCVVDTNFPNNQLAKETLRQICIRQRYSPRKLIRYMWKMKQGIAAQIALGSWNPKHLELYSWRVITELNMNMELVKMCYLNSFKLVGSDGKCSGS
jgi:hypothetical protein